MVQRTVRHFLTAALAIGAAASAWAQPVMGDDLIKNGQFDLFITTNTAAGTVLYRQPADWNCTNYPRYNRACGYDATTGTAIIYSAPAGNTPTSLMSAPANPQWWQAVQVPVAGTYQLTVQVTKGGGTYSTSENVKQAVVIKDGLTVLISEPHANLTPGVTKTLTVPVTLTAGAHYLYLGTAARTLSGKVGYAYSFSQVKLTYLGY